MLAVGRRVVAGEVDGAMYVPRRLFVIPGDELREGALPDPPGAKREDDDDRPKSDDDRRVLPTERPGEIDGDRRVELRELEPKRDELLDRLREPTLDERLRELDPTLLLLEELRDGALRPTLRLREGELRPTLREAPLDRPPPREIPPRLPPEPDPTDEPPDRRCASSRSGTSVTKVAASAKIRNILDLTDMNRILV